MSDNHMENSQAGNSTNTVWQIVGRLITAGIVLAITAFFTPGFEISNLGSLAIATIVLTVIDFLIAKYFVAGYVISWMAAIIGALIYGIVDYFLPGDEQM